MAKLHSAAFIYKEYLNNAIGNLLNMLTIGLNVSQWFTLADQTPTIMLQNTQDTPLFFAVKHIIKPHTAKIIYNIQYDDSNHFIMKTYRMDDCEQLDNSPKLEPDILEAICRVISEVEKGYKKVPPIENINIDIFNILAKK
jgi:hypothetical protein